MRALCTNDRVQCVLVGTIHAMHSSVVIIMLFEYDLVIRQPLWWGHAHNHMGWQGMGPGGCFLCV